MEKDVRYLGEGLSLHWLIALPLSTVISFAGSGIIDLMGSTKKE